MTNINTDIIIEISTLSLEIVNERMKDLKYIDQTTKRKLQKDEDKLKELIISVAGKL